MVPARVDGTYQEDLAMNKLPRDFGTFIGRYKGVSLYTDGGVIRYLFGWAPQQAHSIRAAKLRITRWIKET